MYGFQPSVFALIGVGTSLFIGYPRQVEKWKQKPPEIKKVSALRRWGSFVFGLVFAGVYSILFSPNGSYTIKNFFIVSVLIGIDIAIMVYGMKKYSKPATKL